MNHLRRHRESRWLVRRPYADAGIVAPGTVMADDPTGEYFDGNDRDRAAFEAGIKLGSIAHQYVGAPLTEATAPSLQRAIEPATRVQPLVERVRVRIDRKRM